MSDDVITIELSDRQWETRQTWLAKSHDRERWAKQALESQKQAMHPGNSTIVPAGAVWVCHGAWEFGEFTADEEEAQWPDEAIRQRCAPQPVIGWRVTNTRVELGMPGSTPNLLLQDGEYEGNFTDAAFGNTPEVAIAEARRILAAKKAESDADQAKCAKAQHRIFNVYGSRCHCGSRPIKFARSADEA